MDIAPIILKDNLSKEQIEYLQKQKAEYKLKNKVRCVPGHTLFFTTINGKLSDETIKLINQMAKKAYGRK